MQSNSSKPVSAGIIAAIIATMIWAGNFIIARGIIKNIQPVTLSFYRWLLASVVLLPFAAASLKHDWNIVRRNLLFFIAAAATGISMFNTFVYIGGHFSEAINLALIGTTSSPVFSVILAAIFLKEKISAYRLTGMLICVIGILILLSRGDIRNLATFRFSTGDLWVLAAALSFSVYNTLIKKAPRELPGTRLLFWIFSIGTLFLLPFYLLEYSRYGGFEITANSIGVLIYLGVGASVICFMLWNFAIKRLGSARTALFGNLIPVFSTIEAVIILNEKIGKEHIIAFFVIALGLIIANIQKNKPAVS